jgi:Fic family protein
MATFRRFLIAGRRHYSSQQNPTRLELLKTVYSPAFEKLQKSTPEYTALARSGKVWENFFKPQNIKPYLAAQAKLQDILNCADKHKLFFSKRTDVMKTVTRALVTEYAHQSTAIEGNNLRIGDALDIEDELEKQSSLTLSDLAGMSSQTLANLSLPAPDALLSSKDPAQVAELRNHIIVSRYLVEIGLANSGTAGISLTDIKQLSRAMLVETASEKLYTHGWGKRIGLGEFRSASIAVRSNPMRIFPYPAEVPACMERFVNWRDDCHASQQLHPLILATHLFVYFCHIHPFPDGNGRVGRALMADYMVRQGYMPVVFMNMDREDYFRMVSNAQDGEPEELCRDVAHTQAEMLFVISQR